MPYDKDLRDLLKATKKAARPLPKTITERIQRALESSPADGSATSDTQQTTS